MAKTDSKPVSQTRSPSDCDLAAARKRLHDMVRRSLGECAISHAAPGAVPPGDRCVGLYLLQFGAAATPSKLQHLLQFNARFLVTTSGPDAASASDDLAELAFAALTEPDVEFDVEPLACGTWMAFGTAPRPSFTLSMVLRRTRRVEAAGPVREAVLQLTQRPGP